jgi:hypothetical protein
MGRDIGDLCDHPDTCILCVETDLREAMARMGIRIDSVFGRQQRSVRPYQDYDSYWLCDVLPDSAKEKTKERKVWILSAAKILMAKPKKTNRQMFSNHQLPCHSLAL